MNFRFTFTLFLLFKGSFMLSADEHSGKSPFSEKNPAPAKSVIWDTPSDSELTFYVPGFLPWSDVTMGFKGAQANTQFGADVLLKNLNMIALGGLEGRKGDWGFVLEGMYLDLGVSGNPPGRFINNISVDFKQLISEGSITYRIHEGERGNIDLLAGARYYWLEGDLSIAGGFIRPFTRNVTQSKGWVDPIVGLRTEFMITDDLYFTARGDLGGFGVSAKQDYNLYGALGAKVKENTTVEVGIRHMGVLYSRGNFLFDASFTGPFVATMIHF